MYHQIPDFPRLDHPVPAMARLHLQDLHRQAAQVRLARLAAKHEEATSPAHQAVARRVWHIVWTGIRTAALRIAAGVRATQPVAASDA